MKQENDIEKNYYGDEAPTWKDFVIVIIVILLITGLSWSAYLIFGRLH